MALLEQVENTTKSKILGYLNKNGEASVNCLSDFLKLTHMAVRKHLNSLTIQGIVTTRTHIKSIGRPQVIYFIKQEPKSITSEFTNEFLDSIKETYGRNTVIDLVKKRNKKFYEQYKNRLENKTVLERVYETAKIFNEYDFNTVVEEDIKNKKVTLRHKICPMSQVVSEHPEPCLLEPELIESLVGTKVNRICYIRDGSSSCGYEVLI